MDFQYQEKYLKYKSKYLNLKKQSLVQSGGAPTCTIKVPSKEHMTHYINSKMNKKLKINKYKTKLKYNKMHQAIHESELDDIYFQYI